MGYSSRNTLLTLLVLAFGLGAIVPAAWAQEECYLPITGPSQVCDGTVQLCGPGGYSAYAWTGPDGFSASTRCISVSASGTYSLRAFDPIAGLWFGPCEHVLALGASVASVAISGASSVCPGATVELCGPEPASAFEWSGPGDFTASTACVQVGTPGTYSLRVQMSADGCWSPPSEHVVAAGSCGEDPGNCPRPPWFWKWQCLSLRRVFSRDQILQVASCVNGRSQFFAWGDPLTGFGRVITRQCDLRDRAKRQFAAVWANVCACDLDLSPRCGPKIGLALSTAVHLESLDTTLGDWLAQTDATLAALEGRSLRDRAVKNGYREVIATSPNLKETTSPPLRARIQWMGRAKVMVSEPQRLDLGKLNPRINAGKSSGRRSAVDRPAVDLLTAR